MSSNLETEPSSASGVCVGPISSADVLVTLAKKFMGSIVLWARNGELYVRSITLAAFLNASSGLPSFLLSSTLPVLMASSKFFKCISEFSISLITSQLALMALLAFISCQVESPTIAISCKKPFSSDQLGSLIAVSIIKASFTPGILLISSSLKSFTFMPKAGGCCIIASCIPSLLKSNPNRGLPVTILFASTFLTLVPINLNSFVSLSSTSSGISIPTAFEAISPYVMVRSPLFSLIIP